MNYTTLTRVKLVLGANEDTDDVLIGEKIAEASRTIDTTLCHAEADYFKAETVTAEEVRGIVTRDGVIVCWPKKVIVNSVSAFAYRYSPRESWAVVESSAIAITNHRQVSAWGSGARANTPVFVRVTYAGGYGTETPATEEVIADPQAIPPIEGVPATPATITGLPDDVIDMATVLAVRFYKEEKGGLTDAIGVADFGTMQYTRALPARVVEMAKPYVRIIA